MKRISEDEERRRLERIRALKGARIIFNERYSALNCTIRNISAIGCKLVLETPASLPDAFSLRLADGSEQRCAVRWRDLTTLGVEFLDG